MCKGRFPSLFIAIVLLGQIGWAGGSRVGGGSGMTSDNKLNFNDTYKVDLPVPFVKLNVLDDIVRLDSDRPVIQPGFLSASIRSQQIKLMDFRKENPQLVFTTKQDALTHYQALNWKPLSVDKSCFASMTRENSDLITAVVISAPNEGYIVTVPNTVEAKNALQKLVKSTEVSRGCGWK